MSSEVVAEVVGKMLDYVEQGKTHQTDRVKSVPTENYTDPARWQREIDTIFRRVPLMLAISAELPKPGDYKAMEVTGLPVLITRDKDGLAHAFLNVCAHRGAPVAKLGHGNCARFTCGYHGWTFANDGRLLAVADREKFGDVDKSQRGLRELPCQERGGMIFVVLTPGAPIDVEAYLGGALQDFEAAGLAKWSYLGCRKLAGANWKIAYDGNLEGYHFAALHPTTIHPRTYSNVMHYEAFGPHLRIGFPQVSIGELRKMPREQWPARENKGYDFVRTIFPNTSVFIAPEITQFMQIFPGPTPDQNHTTLIFARKNPPKDEADKAAVEGMMNFLHDVVNGEDYAIGLKIQEGLEAKAFGSVIFGKNERGNQYFHEWTDWYVNGDLKAPKPVL
jgi:phenylpropionate dioxygenase-like ring-hydroxylating dioxygenase large terminal subunit